jgi:hypothetical protein
VTMTIDKSTDDHQLPHVRRKLGHAIHALINPVPEITNGKIRHTESLYHQLAQAIPGSKQHRSGVAQSQPPMWLDAMDLLTEIDTHVRRWQPDTDTYQGPPTVARLTLIDQRTWRPQDTPLLAGYANQLKAWTKRIQTLLTDQHVKHLPAACPACDKTTIYRRDSAGELVRQPALQITTHGCECQACHTTWGPEKFLFLAKLLGYALPAGVLE